MKLIDSDFHTEDEISAWEDDKIYSLQVCEIENLFLDENILSEAISRFLSQLTITEIKKKLFSFLTKDINQQSMLFVRDKVNSYLSGSLLQEKKDITKLKEVLKEISNSIDAEELYKQHQEELKEIVETTDYDGLIKKIIAKDYVMN